MQQALNFKFIFYFFFSLFFYHSVNARGLRMNHQSEKQKLKMLSAARIASFLTTNASLYVWSNRRFYVEINRNTMSSYCRGAWNKDMSAILLLFIITNTD